MRLLIFILLILIMTNSLFAEQSFAEQSIKVITYNLMGMKPGTNYQTRLYYIIQNLKTLDADIIGLQEINETITSDGADNMAKIIAESLSVYFGINYNYYYIKTHIGWNQFYESIGIISKHPVQQQSFVQLACGAFCRKAVWNYINTPIGMVNFFNTHLDYQSDDVRIQEVNQIKNFINQQERDYPGIASILTGDFNCTPESAPILLLTNTGTDTFYLDTYKVANPSSPGYTVPSDAPTSRIDYVFYRSTGSLAIDTSIVIMDKPYDGVNYCSDHRGVMTTFSKLNTTVDEQDSQSIIKDINISNNYPNPFNSSTTISYYLKQPETVSIKVYNILGQEVANLLYDSQSEGYHSVIWNIKNENSGIYFYRIVAGKSIYTKKCVILK